MQWQIGNVRITKIDEFAPEPAPMFAMIVPDLTPEKLAEMPWLNPHFVDGALVPIMSIHTLVVESQGAVIVVDTGVGDNKTCALMPEWNNKTSPFLSDLIEAGFDPEKVDYVFSTHMHLDHVGWNTKLVDGSWVPTFSNADYLYGRQEWKHWTEVEPNQMAVGSVVIAESLQPIVDAGLARLVSEGHYITDEVWLEPSPGHTPGHMSVHIKSEGEEGVLSGDVVHHPAQFTHPDWIDNFDSVSSLAASSRRALATQCAGKPIPIIGGHYSAGLMVSEDGEWHFAGGDANHEVTEPQTDLPLPFLRRRT